jgi:hypothetical protein
MQLPTQEENPLYLTFRPRKNRLWGQTSVEGVAESDFSWSSEVIYLRPSDSSSAVHQQDQLSAAQAQGGNLELPYRKRTETHNRIRLSQSTGLGSSACRFRRRFHMGLEDPTSLPPLAAKL